MKQGNFRKKNEIGITLIALVVTIVILLILSGVTINMLLGEEGIIRTAQEAKNTWEGAVANEQESIHNLLNGLNSIMNDNGGTGGGDDNPIDSEEPVDITTVTEIVQKEDGEKAKDTYENIVIVPKGFKVVISEGTTVPEGIVIEDVNGNQFVWIPVGTVHKDNNPENDVMIKLGRYTFDKTNGTPTIQQAAFAGDNLSNPDQTYEDEAIVSDSYDYKELTTYRAGIPSNGLDGLNATAKNLAGFVQSVKDNGGYYLARYEASYGSGYNSNGSTDAEKYANAKPLSKISTANSTSSMTYDTPGKLWNFISQMNASKVSQNMYANDSNVGVESDLTNSYAWDTAIVFIQSMNSANSNYANKEDGNGTLKNTGETGDEACNIFDMGANVIEWNTEYSTRTNSSYVLPCTSRGGDYNISDVYTADRYANIATFSYNDIGFRTLLYVK